MGMSQLIIRPAIARTKILKNVFIIEAGDCSNIGALRVWMSEPIALQKRKYGVSKALESWLRSNKITSTSILLLPLAACGGVSSSSDNTESDRTETVQGYVFDGYISGATVFLDLDADGSKGINEPSSTTSNSGLFNISTVPGTENSKIKVLAGGIDVDTGEIFKGSLTAPGGSTVVSPLTTMIVELSSVLNITDQEAVSHLQNAMSLQGIDILNTDPFAGSGDLALAKATTLLGTAMQLGSSDNEADALLSTIAGKLVDQVNGDTLSTFNLQSQLQDAVWVKNVLTTSIPSISDPQFKAAIFAQRASDIQQTNTVSDLSNLQSNANAVFGSNGVSVGNGFNLS